MLLARPSRLVVVRAALLLHYCRCANVAKAQFAVPARPTRNVVALPLAALPAPFEFLNRHAWKRNLFEVAVVLGATSAAHPAYL